ncbi:MAG: cyclase family protein [Terriglobales bacterium]|jgi:kynurenine formamidase
MRIRSFIIAYALVLAILLFADRRPGSTQQDRYSHVVDLTVGQSTNAKDASASDSGTRILAPAAFIPGTWAAGQIPPERLVAPLVVMDLNAAVEGSAQISLDDIAAWESLHGIIPQGAVVAIRVGALRATSTDVVSNDDRSPRPLASLPITRDAAMFLIDARYTIGFVVETPVNLTYDRTLAQQLALHGNYVLEGATRFTSLPATGSLIIVAPAKNKKPGDAPVRILAMVK